MKIEFNEEDKRKVKYIAVFFLGLAVGLVFNHGSLNLMPAATNGKATSGGSPSQSSPTAGSTPGDIPEQCKGKGSPETSFCVINSAKKQNNPNLCEKVTSQELKNYCYGYVKGVAERCKKVEDETLREKCMNEVE